MQPNFLTDLNPIQKEAVTFSSGNLLVLAGAGSGKTRVLVYRIAWLLSQGVDLKNILAVTFTNKAAREMCNRLEQMLQISLSSMWVGTFHGLSHRILRLHWQEAGLKEHFQVLDAEDQVRLLKRIHKTLDLDQEKWPVRNSQSFINNNKEQGARATSLKSHNPNVVILTNVYRIYEETCERNGLVDFTELLLRTCELWRGKQQLKEYYQKKFSHILVDEFQDTNSLQYTWVKLLFSCSSNLTIVGDDDQSIYSWRGADSNNMRRFTKDYPNVHTIRLEQNYRSTANILGAANAVIANNNGRLGKKLWTKCDEGEPVVIYSAYNEVDEARYLTDKIRSWVKQDNSFNDVAVLYRANAQSRVIEEQLLSANLPYRVYGGVRFFERSEIKDVLAYLRLLVNHNDDAAFGRVVNLPARGIGEATLKLLHNYTRSHGCSLWDAVQAMVTTGQIPSRPANALNNFVRLINEGKAQISKLDLASLINFIINITELHSHYAKPQYDEYRQSRLENLEELVTAATQFSISSVDNRQILQDFLSHVVLESGEHTDDSSSCVKLMTLHAAKGLEFPIVFLCGLEEGLFPHAMSMGDQEDLEEERRLCYVGMTRAMRKLYLLYTTFRQSQRVSSFRSPSRFLREVPSKFVVKDTLVNKVSHTTLGVMPKIENKVRGFYIGQQVYNKSFGEGVIIGFEGQDELTLVQIKFKKFGIKLLSLQYASLKAV